MSEITDLAAELLKSIDGPREKRLREAVAFHGETYRNERFLLRLLDAERARADAAEAKVADAWDQGYAEGSDDMFNEYDKKSPNPYRKA